MFRQQGLEPLAVSTVQSTPHQRLQTHHERGGGNTFCPLTHDSPASDRMAGLSISWAAEPGAVGGKGAERGNSLAREGRDKKKSLLLARHSASRQVERQNCPSLLIQQDFSGNEFNGSGPVRSWWQMWTFLRSVSAGPVDP